MASRRVSVEIVGNARGLERSLTLAAGRLATFGLGAVGVQKILEGTIGAAGDFEAQLDKVRAASGATGRDMEKLRSQALKFGQSSTFSAREVAGAQTELAKAGRSTAQIIRGDLAAALALAQAGNVDVAESAAFTSNVMGLFGKEITRTTMIADAFTTAANSTTADVADFGMAMTQGGSAAHAAGLDFIETTTILEALAKAGTKNSDAGTSMKAAITSLAAPTKQAKDAMEKYGLSFFDSNKEMRKAATIADMLREKTGSLGKQDRLALFSRLAGTDGMRVLNALYEAGGKKITGYERSLSKQGTASKQAAVLTDNYNSKLKIFQNAVDVAGIKLGTKFLPQLTDFLTEGTGKVNQIDIDKVANRIGDGFAAAGNAIQAATPLVKNAVAVFVPLGKALAAVTGQAAKFANTDFGKFALQVGGAGLVGRKALSTIESVTGAGRSVVGKGGGLLGGAATGTMNVRAGVVNVIGPGGIPGGGVGGKAGERGASGSVAARIIGAIGRSPLKAGAGGALVGSLAFPDTAGATPQPGQLFGSRVGLDSTSGRLQREMAATFQKTVIASYRTAAGKGWEAFATESGAAAKRAFPSLEGTGREVFRRAFATEGGEKAARAGITAALAAFEKAASGGKGKGAGERIARQTVAGLKQLGPLARGVAADSIIALANGLEAKGRLPRGTAARIVAGIETEFGRLPGVTQASAGSAAAAFAAAMNTIQGTATGAIATIGNLIGSLSRIPSIKRVTIAVSQAVGVPSAVTSAVGAAVRAAGGQGQKEYQDQNSRRGEKKRTYVIDGEKVVLTPSEYREIANDKKVSRYQAQIRDPNTPLGLRVLLAGIKGAAGRVNQGVPTFRGFSDQSRRSAATVGAEYFTTDGGLKGGLDPATIATKLEKDRRDARAKRIRQELQVLAKERKALLNRQAKARGDLRAALRSRNRAAGKIRQLVADLDDAIKANSADLAELQAEARGLGLDAAVQVAQEADQAAQDRKAADQDTADKQATADQSAADRALAAIGNGLGTDGLDDTATRTPLLAQIGLASITDTTADDLTAAQSLLNLDQGELASAQARGDYNAIISLTSEIRGLMDQIKALNEATPPGGVQVTQNIYPAGVAADDPQALMAAASYWLRREIGVAS